MSHISGKETKPEILVRKLLFAKGFRYRKNVKTLRGKPDIVLPKYKTAVFIHGCFWHGHEGCVKANLPDTRKEFWENKISGNIIRDKEDINILKKDKWKVITIWQCEINNVAKRNKRVDLLSNELRINC
jgi:DNA mismatch endonuclease, patch repair protein